MANSNFVVHNGLSVGPTTIDAASGNISIPVGKQITIGNIILRDNGGGRLAIRDITDNNDVVVDATLDSGSQTFGNLQFGTNHIESINADGPVSIRPNGAGTLVFAANLVSAGKGYGDFTIATGMAMPAEYGVTYANANIILSPGRLGYGGNVRVSQTTPAVSTTSGAFQVVGGAAIGGALWVAGNIVLPAGGGNVIIGTVVAPHANSPLDVSVNANSYAQINIQNISSVGTNASSDFVATAPNGTDTSNYIDMGINGNLFVSPGSAWTISGALDGYVYVNGGHLTIGTDTAAKDLIFHTGGTTADKIRARYFDTAANLTVFSGLATAGSITPTASNVYNLGSTTNWWSKAFTVSATAQYADLAENYVGDTSYAAGTVVAFGGTHEITLCDTDMSSRVAGVVSTNPAYLMNGTQTGENIVAVALTGRVPTKVRGPIRKGDLIVSAGEGHARAETLPQVGTVIGKALEDFDGDTGVIEVVVGKH